VATKKPTAKNGEPKKKAAAATKRPRKKKGVSEPGSRGVGPREITAGTPPENAAGLAKKIEAAGGTVIGTYRDPLGGNWQIFAALPIEKVAPTPFQRDLSATHVARLGEVIDKLDRFLDPIVAVAEESGGFWTPNGNHRLSAMRNLGAKSITAIVVPEMEVAYRILALNTEKAHNLREKALEVIRMARSLSELDPRAENEFMLEFEDPSLLTLGLAYEQRGRFSGGAYAPLLKRVDKFLETPLPKSLQTRIQRAERLLEVDDAVVEAVNALKEKGFQSPYLKAFVVARTNPIRFLKGEPPPFEDTLEKMLSAAKKFDVGKVKVDQIASTGGPPPEE
jgi:ParB family transcriptional regulator, chromosome partitioning protein